MNLEIALLLFTSLGWIWTAVLYFRSTRRGDDLEKWYRDELNSHEKTRQTLRDAVARLRRENRDKFLGIIEEQRSA